MDAFSFLVALMPSPPWHDSMPSGGGVQSIGYKLHVDTADGGIPISCIMTSASTHDSQVAVPLGTLTAGRVENLYDLMDAAYDSIEIWAHSILLGHKPIIDVNPRSSVDMQEALKREKKARRTLGLVFPEERRYVVAPGPSGSMGGSRMSSAAAMSACAGTTRFSPNVRHDRANGQPADAPSADLRLLPRQFIPKRRRKYRMEARIRPVAIKMRQLPCADVVAFRCSCAAPNRSSQAARLNENHKQ